MRKSTYKIPKSALSFLAVSILLMIASQCNHPVGMDLVRIAYSHGGSAKTFSHETAGFTLKKVDSYLYFKKPHKAFSIKGIFLERPQKATDNSDNIVIEPRLKGRYYMDLFYLLIEPEDKTGLSVLHILHRRREKTLKKIRLPGTLKFERQQIPLVLSPEDRIELQVKSDAITVGVLGEPIFYPENEQQKKNLVFIIVADTLRRDRLGIYDPDVRCSPAIDRFGRDAVIFHQAYSTSPWTLPAHMSLFTGLPAHVHGVNNGNEKIGFQIPILFESLQKKFINYCLNANGYMSGLYGFSRGFDFYEESFRDHLSRTAARDLFRGARKLVLTEKHSHALFLLHTYQIHTPYVPEIELAEDYYQNRLGLDDFRRFNFNPIEFIRNGKELFKKVPDLENQAIEHIYEAGVYTFDYRFGEFIEFLKTRNLYDNATIILLSDHGEEFNDHGAWEHGHSLYNELIKIPLLVKFPGRKYAGRRVDIPVCITDVLPTIMEWYGIPEAEKDSIGGISLLEAIKGKERTRRRLIFSYLAGHSLRTGIPEKMALISDQLKYIHQKPMGAKARKFFTIPPPLLRNEMYDIFEDPAEKNNIRIHHRKKEKEFSRIIKELKLKRGQKGDFKELEKILKTLGYLD